MVSSPSFDSRKGQDNSSILYYFCEKHTGLWLNQLITEILAIDRGMIDAVVFCQNLIFAYIRGDLQKYLQLNDQRQPVQLHKSCIKGQFSYTQAKPSPE